MALHGQAYWPGASIVKGGSYILSHGTAPGVIRLSLGPRSRPVMFGDFRFSDGIREFVIPRCKVDQPRSRRARDGTVADLYIFDQRWRWKDLGNLRETYNQVDSDGEPYQHMKRTPEQLCEICLRAMRVEQYRIILPPVTVLPPVNWSNVPPATALESLCNSLGVRVCYNPFTGAVLICPLGVGAELPSGFITEESISLDLPERPDAMHCVGAPIRYQARFKMVPLAEEWNKEYVPLNDVSYRPALQGAVVHKIKATPSGNIVAGDTFTIRLDDIEFSFTYESGIDPVATVVAGLKAQIDLAPQLPYRATNQTTHLEVQGDGDGTSFDVVTSVVSTLTASFPSVLLTQGVSAQEEPWAQVPVYGMATVQATDRLNLFEAIEKAKNSVFRVYGLTIETPEIDGQGAWQCPDYGGAIVRKEQIVLQQTRAEQIEPTFEELDHLGRPVELLDEQGRLKQKLFYDGHSRDKPAAAYGSYFICIGKRQNTDPETEILVPFSIDPVKQIITFARPVYTATPGVNAAAEVVLEVAFNLRDADTNGLVCVEGLREFPEPHFGTDPLTIVREDVQITKIGVYDDSHRLIDVVSENFEDAQQRLDYYMLAYSAQFEVTSSQTRTYPGIHLVELDGAIQQITWNVGSGSTTIVSRNSEHSHGVQPFPARQKKEALDPIIKGRRGANPPLLPGGAPGMIDMWQPSQGKVDPR